MTSYDISLLNLLNNVSASTLKIGYIVSDSYYLLILLVLLLSFKENRKKGFFVGFILAFSFILNLTLKYLFNFSRPYEEISNLNIISEPGTPSFPSQHAQSSFNAAILSPRFNLIFYLWAFLISLSRIVLGVHYLSDIAVGAVLGYLIGFIAIKKERKVINFLYELETRRQFVHAFFGLIIFRMVYILPEYDSKIILSALTLIVILISYIKKKGVKLPLVDFIIKNFGRKNETPAKGTIFFLIGSLTTLFIFHSYIASLSILILGLHDSFATLVGKEFGKRKIPYNKNKTVEGSISGIIISFIGAYFFFPLNIALIAVLAAGIIESMDLKIDDNLSIPLAIGFVIYLLL